MIPRIYDDIEAYLKPGEVLIIYGPRQVGKTTLVKNFAARTNLKYRYDTGDNLDVQEILASRKLSRISEYVEGYQLIIIDEAQVIPHIGEALKLIIDHYPDISVIATGSSSFRLRGQVEEPLTGRKRTLILYPVSQMEFLTQLKNKYDLKQKLEESLVYGSYPKIAIEADKQEKQVDIKDIVNSYLFKDILIHEGVKDSQVIRDLVKLLAFQIGKEVSFGELASKLNTNRVTIARYVDLLEKSFIIFRLGGYSSNLRNEITNKNKYFFYDLGVRNGLINQFNTLSDRNDIGELWENFITLERMKKLEYSRIASSEYFWRTYEQKEIDLIEERDGKLFAYEFKWGNKQPSAPKEWTDNYPDAKYEVINQENYLDFIT